MMQGGLLDGTEIRRLLEGVAAALIGPGDCHTVIVVGGSLLAWHGLRETTADVDSIRPIDNELREAVREVATRNGLAVDWLNDSAAAFAPVTLVLDSCHVLFEHGRLRVLGASFRDVFLMKLRRAFPQDLDDMRVVWPLVVPGFRSAKDLVETFHEAFPLEQQDEYLAQFVVDELAKGGYSFGLE